MPVVGVKTTCPHLTRPTDCAYGRSGHLTLGFMHDPDAGGCSAPPPTKAFFSALPRLNLPPRAWSVLMVLRNRDACKQKIRPTSLQFFVDSTGLSTTQVSRALFDLEVAGIVMRKRAGRVGFLIQVVYDPEQWAANERPSFAAPANLICSSCNSNEPLTIYREEDRTKKDDSPLPPKEMEVPLSPAISAAWEAWQPMAFTQDVVRELHALHTEFGEQAVLDAIAATRLRQRPPAYPLGYLRTVCQNSTTVSIARTAEAVGAQLTTSTQRQATNRKTVASADAPPEVKQVLLALMDGFGLFSVAEPLPIALREIDRIITEQAPALDPATEDRTKTAALLAWALTHLPANHWLRGKISRVAAFDRNVSAITATIAQKIAADEQAARIASLAAEQAERQKRFDAYKRSILPQ